MIASTHEKDLKRAIRYVYLLLKTRFRSEHELREKLMRKEYSNNIVEEVIQYFKNYKLVDDQLFTQQWITSRLNRQFGSNRIRFELIRKGVDQDIINDELNKECEDISEFDSAFDLAQRRAQKYKGLDKKVIQRRIYGYLARRGFNANIIYKVVNEL